jgi:hypothetical protein
VAQARDYIRAVARWWHKPATTSTTAYRVLSGTWRQLRNHLLPPACARYRVLSSQRPRLAGIAR